MRPARTAEAPRWFELNCRAVVIAIGELQTGGSDQRLAPNKLWLCGGVRHAPMWNGALAVAFAFLVA